MSNIYDFGVNGTRASVVGGTGTPIKYFPRLLGIGGPFIIGSAGLGGVSGNFVAAPLFGNAPTTPSASSAVGSLYLPAQNDSNGQQLTILATGSFGNDTGDPSGTVNVQLRAVTGSLSNPIYTTLASTGAVTPSPFGIVNSWAIELSVYGDSGSGRLGGYYTALQNGALITTPGAKTAVGTDNVISGLDFLNGNPALQQGAVLAFVVGVTFGTSDASNTASLYEFTIES